LDESDLSQQLLVSNRTYGYDPLMEYADLYFPVKDGLNIRVVRFFSLPGLDSPPAPFNYTIKTLTPFLVNALLTLVRRLQAYKTLLCLTNLYCTPVPPMLKYVDHVAAGTAAASRFGLCNPIEPALDRG
jgi:hypothetical protein